MSVGGPAPVDRNTIPRISTRDGKSLVEAARDHAAATSVPRVATVDVEDTRLSDSTKMLLAIARTGKHLYQGTVPAHVTERRRRRNRASRHARRVHRR